MGFLAEAFSSAGFSTLSGAPGPGFQPGAFQTQPFTFQTDVYSVQVAPDTNVVLAETLELAIDATQEAAHFRGAHHLTAPTGQIGTIDSLPAFLDPSTIGPIDTSFAVQQPAAIDLALIEDIYLALDIEQEAARSIATPLLTTTGQLGTIYSRPSFLDLGMVGPVVPPLPMFQGAATIDIAFDVVLGAIILIDIDTEQVPGRMFARIPFVFTGQVGTVHTQPANIDLSAIGPVLPPVFTGDRDFLSLDMAQAAATVDFELIFATLVATAEIQISGQAAFAGAAFTQTAEIQIQGLQPTLAYGWIDPPLRLPIGERLPVPTDPPGGPYTGRPTSHGPSKNIELMYGTGDDAVDISSDILYEDAQFTTSVNGEVGTCYFRLRIHPGHPRTIVTGKRLLLRIKGVPAWDGYVTNVSRAFFTKTEPPRQALHYLVINGADVNILFQKRITVNPENPEEILGHVYKFAETGLVSDLDALHDLYEWLDLSGDNLDLESKLEHVDAINVDQDTVPWDGGMQWIQAMVELAKLPTNIWGIDPDRALYWRDVSTLATVNAPFPLEDDPGHVPGEATAPYREVEIVQDGSDLITDVMVWGAGTGSAKMKFQRYQSDPQDHGRWQYGEKDFSVFTQALTNRIAYSWIFGSPFNKRGHRLEKVSLRVVTFVSGFRSGQLVDFRCRALDFADRVPIRALTITFPAPYLPRYELSMSHEIDSPWGITDVPGITVPVVKEYPTEEAGVGCYFRACSNGWTAGGVVVFADYMDPPSGWTVNTSPHTISGPPYCATILMRGFDTIGSSYFMRMRGGYGLVQRSGFGGDDPTAMITVTAGISDQPGWSGTTSISFPQPSGYSNRSFIMQLRIMIGSVTCKFWYANRREAGAWKATAGSADAGSTAADLRQAVYIKPRGDMFGAGGATANEMALGSLYVPDAGKLTVSGGAAAIAGAPGRWWAWFNEYEYLSDHGWVVQHFPGNYDTPPAYPMANHPGTYPENGELEPIDAYLHGHGGPDTSPYGGGYAGNIFRSPRSLTTVPLGGVVGEANSQGIFVYDRYWGWDMIISGPPGGASTGIVGEEVYHLRGFTPPPGAVSCHFGAHIYACNAGDAVGSPNSDEGPIHWEVWKTNYDGSDAGTSGIIAHEVIASGTLPDFNYFTGSDINQTFEASFGVVPGVPFEITAVITNDYEDWVTTHGPKSGLPLAGARTMSLKWFDVRMYYNHVPQANGALQPCHGFGEHREVIHCGDNPIRLKRAYAKGSTRIWRGGKLQHMDVDYEETTPNKGVITFLVNPGPDCEDDLVISYRGVTESGYAGLARKLRKIRG